LGVLADDCQPRVLPITYAVSEGLLVSAIDYKRKQVVGERVARVRWLRARPQASITVDHYDDDWTTLAWIQAIGVIRILDVASAPEAIAALTNRYEPYRTQPPAGPVLVLTPQRLLWWRASG
jgi:PPOX class probable F420-dependent enzyme